VFRITKKSRLTVCRCPCQGIYNLCSWLRFPQARIPHHQDRLDFLDVAVLCQLEHSLLVGARDAGEVEIRQLLQHREAGRLDAPDGGASRRAGEGDRHAHCDADVERERRIPILSGRCGAARGTAPGGSGSKWWTRYRRQCRTGGGPSSRPGLHWPILAWVRSLGTT
jgi:hypothetical protein